jgi:hypothetical protein
VQLLLVFDPVLPPSGETAPIDSPVGFVLLPPYREPTVASWGESSVSGPTFSYEYKIGAELPALRIPWADGQGFDIDFTTGWTFQFLIGRVNETALVSKSSGLVGGMGFIDVVWSPIITRDLNLLPVGRYDAELRARRTLDGSDRIRAGELIIAAGILG